MKTVNDPIKDLVGETMTFHFLKTLAVIGASPSPKDKQK